MMKSFDDLICYLLGEIALCGEQGAQLSDFVHYIESFYVDPSNLNPNNESGLNHDIGNNHVAVVDHSFQEQVWKWLVAHPDCRVEIRGEKHKTTLSTSEAVNCFPLSPKNGSIEKPTNIEPRPTSSDCTMSGSEIGSEELQKQEATHDPEQSSKSKRDVRVCTTEARMWYALAGHDVDFSKIPQLDFVCLSIIAAAGPSGILQPDLVRISNQDKRSVPRRTQNLHDRGYIIKRPTLTGGSRTSLCLLKRFVQAPSNEEAKNVLPEEDPQSTSNNNESIFKRCFQNDKVDLCALSRAIFDILGDLKIIMLDDLKANLGVIGRRWERRVVSVTLRKLEALGCVKQVKAQDDSLGCASKYFRCVKLIREPVEKESQILFGLANINMRPTSAEVVQDLDSEGDFAEDDKIEQPTGSGSVNDSLQLQKPQEPERPIPQWSGAGCINNNLYDLVHRSGTKGVSTMVSRIKQIFFFQPLLTEKNMQEIKNQLLGKYVLRPIEHQLSRIVDFWQISQPSHLRHLAILRDIAMVNKNSHYVHFSYDNFRKLVDSGEASWEAVTTLGKNDKMGKELAPAFDDESNKDEFGFPKLQSTLFQGRDNDATLAQCVQALNAKPLLLNRNDPVAYKLDDGTYGVRGLDKKQKLEPHQHTPKASDKMLKPSPKPRGRPRKVRSTQPTTKPALDDNRSRTKSQKALDMSANFSKEFVKAREKNSPSNGNNMNSNCMVEKNQDLGTVPSFPLNRKRKRSSSYPVVSNELTREYMPSIIAHTQPILDLSDSLLDNTGLTIKRATRRSLEEPRVEKELSIASRPSKSTEYRDLPSVAAHSKLVFGESDSVTAHSVIKIERPPRQPAKNIRFGQGLAKVSHAGKSNKHKALTYEEQSDMIKRADHGVFIGSVALRARFKGQRGRTKNCRLAIFKSVRLKDFGWFTKNETSSTEEHPSNAWDETRTLPTIEDPNPSTISEIEYSQDPLGFPHLLPEPNSSPKSPGPNCTSHYANSSINDQNGNDTTVEGATERPSLNASTLSKPSEVSNVEDSRYLAGGGGEGFQPLHNDETRSSDLGPPLNISSFTSINQPAISKLSSSGTTKRAPAAEICETDDSYSSASHSTPRPPNLDEVDPPLHDLVFPSHEPISTAKNILATNGDYSPPAADPRAPSNGKTGVSEIALTTESEKRLPQTLQSVNATRGSIGVLRRKIIMDIIEVCGGVFPGHKELVAPFITVWMKLNKPGKPDGRTVHAAYRLLVNSGKLRELKFSFQDMHGLMVTKSMTTKFGIDPTDERVQKTQQNMIAIYPQYFVPVEVEVSEDARQRAHFPNKCLMNRYSADLEVDNETQLRLQHKPGFVVRMENKKAMVEKNRESKGPAERKMEAPRAKRNKAIETAEILGDDIEKFQYQGRFRVSGSTRKVERLATIKRSAKRDVLDLTMPPMVGLQGSFEEYLNHGDTAETNFEFANPVRLSDADELALANLKNLDEEYTISNSRKRRRQYSTVFETSQSPQVPFSQQIKRRKTTDTHGKEFQQMSSIMDPKHLFHQSSGTFSVTFSGLEPPQRGLVSKARKKQDRTRKSKTSYAMRRHSTIMDPTHIFHPPSGTFSVDFNGLEPFQRKPLGTSRKNIENEDDARLTMQKTPIFMNQKPVFHPQSGTFSVGFVGFGFQHQDSPNKSQKAGEKEAKTAFQIEMDDLVSWERSTKNFLSSDHLNWPFINYGIKDYHGVPSQTEYRLDNGFEVSVPDTSGRGTNMPTGFLVFPRAPVFRKSLKDNGRTAPKASKEIDKRKRTRTRLEFKTRPITARASIDDIGIQDGDEMEGQRHDDSRPTKVRRIRGPHKQTPLTPDEEERLLAAVIVIRTLVGGIDKNVDWVLVARLFPAFSQMYIQKRWGQVHHRFRLQIDQVQARFQSKFSKAYEDGIIPTINFDNIEEYDWAWLVDWTTKNIDTSTDSIKRLPARRLDLDEIYDLRATSDNEMPEFFEIDTAVVSHRREVVVNRRSYVYPSEPKIQTSSQGCSDDVAIAKTWIRANVITSEVCYDSKLARTKLSSVGESSIDIALQELLEARLLMQQNKGRLVPGRNYDISDFFLSRMKKRLSASQFYRAAAFKRKLDTDLLAKGSVEFCYTAENGDLLAVLNMLAHKRISVKPKNPPMEKFGLIDGSYVTRRMDKSRLNFDVEIQMEPSYAIGNPLFPLQPAPSQHLEDPMAKIPVWYDIHDNFIPIMWEMALTATMVILAMRPGVTALEMERSMRPSLGAWELEMILEWMVQVKAGKKSGSGFMVDEWWWMCLGEGQMPSTTEMEAEARHERQGSENLNNFDAGLA